MDINKNKSFEKSKVFMATLIFGLLYGLNAQVIQMSQEDDPYASLKKKEINSKYGVKRFQFASYYGNNMVLQRAPHQAVIWGYSPNIGEEITVTLSGTANIYHAIVEMGPDLINGVWMVTLEPKTGGPFIIYADSSEFNISISNVLFGDVWICSGQSNMQFTVSQTFNATQLIDEAAHYNNIRLFTVAETQSIVPLFDLLGIEEHWSIPDKETVGSPPWMYFSSVCWLFGKGLYDERQYPIGLIATDWGGTPVEAWSSKDALHRCGLQDSQFIIQNVYREDVSMASSNLWNAMIHPLLNMTIYGAIWYQGEANRITNVNLYNCTFPEMIADWRLKFSNTGNTDPQFPFGFVQLAAWRPDPTISTGFPDIRWHQTADFGHVPNVRMPKVFMSVAMDLPDFLSPYGSIHPRDKQDVIRRLMWSGLKIAYGRAVPAWEGPLPDLFAYSSSSIVIMYNPSIELEIRTVEGFEICCSIGGNQQCKANISWWLPTPIISYNTTSVSLFPICAEKEKILGIRYAWRETPCQFKKCPIYTTKLNLPAPPFLMHLPPEATRLDQTQTQSLYQKWDNPISIQ